uniref:Venom peptide n=1 Tax=Dasymutilla chiron TaxID=374949 RepID=A0A8T9VUJ9_DASCH|nr:venom peptide precursor [Dasymutilla chiron]
MARLSFLIAILVITTVIAMVASVPVADPGPPGRIGAATSFVRASKTTTTKRPTTPKPKPKPKPKSG